ncbi:MAG: MATE family efflux transporter [Myxococcota bacterium]|nr:MATE family efflux transporter [Myxococcota bacterium]
MTSGGSTPSSRETRAQLALAIPLSLQQIGVQLMGSVDAAMLGHYSDSALAGAGIGNNLLFAITAVAMGIVLGLDSIVPRAIGAGRIEDARRSLAAGLRLAFLIGAATTLLVVASPFLLHLTNTPDDVVRDAKLYVYVRAIGVVPLLLSMAIRAYLSARSTTRPLIIAVVAGNIVNAGLDLILIFGVDSIGLPPMGVAGAGIATVIVQLVIIAVYFFAVRSLDGTAQLPVHSRADMKEIVRYGAPVGGQLLAEIGIFGLATVLAAHLGKVPAAAHSIALNLSSITFSLAMGIGSATSVRVGHAIGAGDRALARRRGIIGLQLGLAAMATFASIFVIAPQVLTRIFTEDAFVIAATIPLLQIAALFQLSDGTQAIGAGALRGLGETRATLIGNVIGHYGIGLGISLTLAFGVGMGAPGLWWGLSAGLTATAIYLVLRFLRSTR